MKDVYELKRLGELYLEKGDYHAAEMLFRRAISVEELRAPNTVSLAQDLYNYGLVCSVLGNLKDAQNSLMRAWSIERTILGPMHPETLETLRTLTEIYNEQENTVTSEFFFFVPPQTADGSVAYH
jgi:tetratricopeptide (TPR) repeat protein